MMSVDAVRPLAIGTQEAARLCNRNVKAIRAAIYEGELPVIIVGTGKARKYLIRVEALEAWLKAQERRTPFAA